jgi:large subunit ribosomal protein L9
MEVILLKNDSVLGKKGEVVKVSDGYARNYLIPKNIALKNTEGNARTFQELEKRGELRANKEKRTAEELAKKIEKLSCTATVQAGEDDKLFGSVTAIDIAKLLEDQGVEIDKRKIMLEEPLKALGIYSIPIKLHPEVEAKIKVWVVRA